MFVERVLPPELMYRYRSPKRSPRAPRARSLVNCNHLASSPTKVPSKESLQDELDRQNEAVRYRSAKLANNKNLKGSLKEVAIREYSEDMHRHKLGLKPIRRGKWSAAKDLRRVEGCQSEWIGFAASCCNSRPVAVPIGCNHRLCALCNAARLERYRSPARQLLEVMENPGFLTLTIPSTADLTTKTYADIRKFWNAFFRSNKGFLRGGIYSIETTHNRDDGSWHVHLHAVIDTPWVIKGMKKPVFVDLKMMLEYAWLRITSPEAKKEFRRPEYQRWKAMAEQQEKGSEWNKKFRRVVDIRSVKGGTSAVYELIKYISKTNSFIDRPEAVATYLRAVRSVRVIQTFGRYYNFKMEVPITKADLDALTEAGIETGNIPVGAASFLRCECGKNEFHRIGVFSMADVQMDVDGRWLIRPSHERRRCRGSSTYMEENDGICRASGD